MFDPLFYVGPLGGLRELPDATPTVDVPLTVIGGTHLSLSGAYTRDIFGHKRSWTWAYAGLTTAQLTWVEALQYGLVPGPLYLIDPRRPNRLPVQVATGGSLYRTVDHVIPSNTSVAYWRAHSAISSADVTTLPAAAVLRGAVEWQLLSAGAAGLELAGPALDGRLDVPLLGGETLDVAAWLVGQVGATVTLTATTYTLAGDVAATAVSAPLALSATTWAPVTTQVVCSTDAVRLRLRLDTDANTPTGSVFTTAWSVVNDDAPEQVGPALQDGCAGGDNSGGLRLGGGAPQVVADPGSSSYIAPGLTSAGLTLTERI